MRAALLQRVAPNLAGRDYVVGDIHGYFHVLEALLSHVGFDRQRDRLFSVGDLIDRGPQSERVTEFLLQPWFYAIRGNHEEMLLRGAHTVERAPVDMAAAQLWVANGGDWFFRMRPEQQDEIYRDIAQLAYAIEVPLDDGRLAALVHADVLDDNWGATRAFLAGAGAEYPSDTLMHLVWERSRALAVEQGRDGGAARGRIAVQGIDLIFFGHTPMPRPTACANTRWLDAGIAYGHCLSVAELRVDGRVWSMPQDLRAPKSGWQAIG